MNENKTNAMTLNQARRILGKLADNVTDAELERDIKSAEVLKTLFFSKNNKIVVKLNNK